MKLAVAIAVFAAVVGSLAWKGATALPDEAQREGKQICLPLEPDPGWQVRPAQDFTLKDYLGRPVSLAQYRGKVVFLNFWASWCPPCRDEMASLDRLAAEMQGHPDFAMLLVSEDKGWNDVRDFFSTKNPNIWVVMDEEFRVAHSYGTQKLPETYLIDKQGNVRQYIINKRSWDSPQAVSCLKSMLD